MQDFDEFNNSDDYDRMPFGDAMRWEDNQVALDNDAERLERELEELDEKYHNHLQYGQNCHLCGIEHAALWPTLGEEDE